MYFLFRAVPPDIISEETSADVSVQEQDNVTLLCRATGHPPPKVTWRREDHEPILLKKFSSRELYKVESYTGSALPCGALIAGRWARFFASPPMTFPAVSKRITLNVNSYNKIFPRVNSQTGGVNITRIQYADGAEVIEDSAGCVSFPGQYSDKRELIPALPLLVTHPCV
ncbi:Hemicentin-1 [Eumeta japonica]|uniref:Hemicentin-1 n=1 Tax=Eumeta variegata TaxID=151549 RepID=A0A4C1UCN3_EUMVA|nr:Hemicentin-1 [Eumeta japonica]